MSMPEPRVIMRSRRICVSLLFNAVIVDTRGEFDVATMLALEGVYRELIEAYPRGIVVLVLLGRTMPVPSRDATAETVRVLKSLGDSLLQLVAVIEGRELAHQLMRSMMRGINVLTRNARVSTTDNLDSAVHSLAQYIAPELARRQAEAEILLAIESVRTAYDDALLFGL